MTHVTVFRPDNDRRDEFSVSYLPGFDYMADVVTARASGLVPPVSVETPLTEARYPHTPIRRRLRARP